MTDRLGRLLLVTLEAARVDADARGWRATFYTTGMEHSPTSATGTGWEPTSWHATQRAAWEALKRALKP